MNRLFTFGCSYTEFYWPTWSDCLSPYFNETYNYGKCGAGNSYIFNQLASIVASNKLTEKDTVIIQLKIVKCRFSSLRVMPWYY